MKTPICERFDIEFPLFAFSHCRDVVAAVTNAGGLGVLGGTAFTPEQLDQELAWIDEQVRGKPYGVDIIVPAKYEGKGENVTAAQLADRIPDYYTSYVRELLVSHGIPAEEGPRFGGSSLSGDTGEALLEVALRHPIKLMANALGVPPAYMIEAGRASGVPVAALVGAKEHALKQAKAGVDIIVAQGTEAGGHTGQIATMVLVPQVVDVAGPDIAVLAAGGISRGRQIAAAFALGAQGVWTGTIWLGTRESELTPMEKEVLFKAKSEDAVQRKWMTGKTVRMIRSKASEAWEQPGAPRHLKPPLQNILYHGARIRIEKAHRDDLCSFPAGQVVGNMKEETSVRQVMQDLMQEYIDTAERISPLINL